MKKQEIEQKIHQAYLELASQGKPEPLNVRRITQQAGIARSTFYTHYDNMEQLVQDLENGVLLPLQELFAAQVCCPFACEKDRQILLEIICFFRRRQEWIAVLCANPHGAFPSRLSALVQESLEKRLAYWSLSYTSAELAFATAGLLTLPSLLRVRGPENDPTLAQEYSHLLGKLWQ